MYVLVYNKIKSSLKQSILEINELPVGTHADVMHIKLDGFGLLLVFEMVISQQVVDLVYDGRRGSTALRKAWGLGENKSRHFS